MIEEIPNIKLYTQYLSDQFLEDYFAWNSKILQRIFAEVMRLNIDSYNELSGDILQLYAGYAFGLKKPSVFPETARYDQGLLYDNGVEYDEITDAQFISDDMMKAFIFWKVRKDIMSNNLVNLYKRIKDFCGLNYSDITITETSVNNFIIQLPSSDITTMLRELLISKKLNIGFGIAVEVELV